jgi:hypothetical protein
LGEAAKGSTPATRGKLYVTRRVSEGMALSLAHASG